MSKKRSLLYIVCVVLTLASALASVAAADDPAASHAELAMQISTLADSLVLESARLVPIDQCPGGGGSSGSGDVDQIPLELLEFRDVSTAEAGKVNAYLYDKIVKNEGDLREAFLWMEGLSGAAPRRMRDVIPLATAALGEGEYGGVVYSQVSRAGWVGVVNRVGNYLVNTRTVYVRKTPSRVDPSVEFRYSLNVRSLAGEGVRVWFAIRALGDRLTQAELEELWNETGQRSLAWEDSVIGPAGQEFTGAAAGRVLQPHTIQVPVATQAISAAVLRFRDALESGEELRVLQAAIGLYDVWEGQSDIAREEQDEHPFEFGSAVTLLGWHLFYGRGDTARR